MTIDQIAIFLIVILTFSLFVWGRWRYDIISIIALCSLYIADQILGGETSALIVDTSIPYTESPINASPDNLINILSFIL